MNLVIVHIPILKKSYQGSYQLYNRSDPSIWFPSSESPQKLDTWTLGPAWVSRLTLLSEPYISKCVKPAHLFLNRMVVVLRSNYQVEN